MNRLIILHKNCIDYHGIISKQIQFFCPVRLKFKNMKFIESRSSAYGASCHFLLPFLNAIAVKFMPTILPNYSWQETIVLHQANTARLVISHYINL
jgi:hypothetical protein